jgi:hypothetical protein
MGENKKQKTKNQQQKQKTFTVKVFFPSIAPES